MSDSDRRAEFEAQLAEVRIKTGTAETEQRWMTVGMVLAVIGVIVAVVSAIASQGLADPRDIQNAIVFAVAGLSLSVLGGAVWLRYSVGRFMRFWMLRLIYEQQDPEDE